MSRQVPAPRRPCPQPVRSQGPLAQIRLRCTLLLLGLASLGVPFARAEALSNNAGFLYGVVTTASGKEYRGFLRWGTEEAFWDDLFHSAKEELPYLEAAPRHVERRRRGFRIFGQELGGDEASSRIFIARFGDIQEIFVHRNERAEVRMKGGEVFQVKGYSNDVDGTVHVNDPVAGEIDIDWDRIDTIRFAAAPRDADPGVTRLHGKVETRSGTFEGFVQWDKQECTSADILNGESDDGKMEIRMGSIRAIERRSRRSAAVELADGRVVVLSGSNDVNDENRGIMVEDPRYGRVTVPWSAFDKVTFQDSPDSGPAYDDYKAQGELQATVTVRGDASKAGRIVFDLDEAYSWEILNGSDRDIEFNVPFAAITAIEPLNDAESRITFQRGEPVVLEDGQDVSGRNAGILVFERGHKDPVYIDWADVTRIDFPR